MYFRISIMAPFDGVVLPLVKQVVMQIFFVANTFSPSLQIGHISWTFERSGGGSLRLCAAREHHAYAHFKENKGDVSMIT
jgi:hypothetical protein